ncbi:hypothetical protein [Spirosoma harenae]
MYQKLTYYLFPFLCLKAIALLGIFFWMVAIEEYYFATVCFCLLLFTDLLILVFNQFMQRDELQSPADDYPQKAGR